MAHEIPSREEAFALLKKHNKSESLINHALSVEAVMRHIAKQNGENPDKWGVIGLVHDLDYESHPDRHCQITEEILLQEEWPEDYIRSVLSHAWELCTDVKPESLMEKYLYAIDELTGLVTACVLVRPSKSLMDLKVKSVRKKWKAKHFAAGASREVMQKGADMLGIEVNELIQLVIDGMRTVASDISLDGSMVVISTPILDK